MAFEKRKQKRMMKVAAKSFVGIGTKSEIVVQILHELSIRYQKESNLFFDSDSEIKEKVLAKALELVSLKKGDSSFMSKGEIKIVESAWEQLFTYLSEADIGFDSLDELLEYLNRSIPSASGGGSLSDEEFADLVSEVNSSKILPERLAELAIEYVNWFNVYEEIEVKSLIAKNPRTPKIALDELSKSAGYETRLNVACNPNTERQTLERLSRDSERIVREAAQERLK